MTALDLGQDWNGFLTLENSQAVATRLAALLEGRRFTYVSVNEGRRHWYPEVKTGQELAGEVTHSAAGDCHDIHLRFSGWHSWLSARVEDEGTARQRNVDAAGPAGPANRDEWLHDKKLVYLRIRSDRVEVERYAPGGNRLYWVLVVEGGDGR